MHYCLFSVRRAICMANLRPNFTNSILNYPQSNDSQAEDPLQALSNKKSVCVQCLWDNPRFHTDSTFLYFLWKQTTPSSPLLKALLTEQTYLNRA